MAMQILILAAGKGERLWPLTKNTPKSLIDLGDGTTILERQILGIHNNNDLFNEILIVTGYKSEQIEAKIREYHANIKIEIIYNPFYDISNNLISVWLANHKLINEDFAITNGDNIYSNSFFREVYNQSVEGINIVVSSKNIYDDDDMKIKLDPNNKIVKISKEIDNTEAKFESVGFIIVRSAKSRKIFRNKVLELVHKPESRNWFWLEILNHLIEDGLPLNMIKVDRESWREVDFHPDISSIRKMIASNSIK